MIGSMNFKKTGSEDTEWNNRVFQRTAKAVLIDREMYYWVMRKTSITHQGINANYIDRANSYLYCLEAIPLTDRFSRACCLEKLYKTMINVRYHAWRTEYQSLAIKTVRSLKTKTFHEFLMNKHISLKMKSVLLLFLYVPMTYKLFMKLCEKRAVRS